MKVKKKNLSENEIDEIVIAQADNENAWTDIKLIKNRVERGSREKFLQALNKVSQITPDEEDKI